MNILNTLMLGLTALAPIKEPYRAVNYYIESKVQYNNWDSIQIGNNIYGYRVLPMVDYEDKYLTVKFNTLQQYWYMANNNMILFYSANMVEITAKTNMTVQTLRTESLNGQYSNTALYDSLLLQGITTQQYQTWDWEGDTTDLHTWTNAININTNNEFNGRYDFIIDELDTLFTDKMSVLDLMESTSKLEFWQNINSNIEKVDIIFQGDYNYYYSNIYVCNFNMTEIQNKNLNPYNLFDTVPIKNTLHYSLQTAPPQTTYEVVDIGGLMFEILVMPFAFISQAFNFTAFPGTPYAINISAIFLTIFYALILIYIIKKIWR